MWDCDTPPPVCGAVTPHPQYVGCQLFHGIASKCYNVCMGYSFTVYQTFIGAMNEKIKRQLAISNPFVFRHISSLKVQPLGIAATTRAISCMIKFSWLHTCIFGNAQRYPYCIKDLHADIFVRNPNNMYSMLYSVQSLYAHSTISHYHVTV